MTLFFRKQSESIFLIFRFIHLKSYTTILTMSLIGLNIQFDTSFILTNRPIVCTCRGLTLTVPCLLPVSRIPYNTLTHRSSILLQVMILCFKRLTVSSLYAKHRCIHITELLCCRRTTPESGYAGPVVGTVLLIFVA